jgi:hypothetical protein
MLALLYEFGLQRSDEVILGIDVQAELRAKTGSPHLGPLSVASVPTPATETPMQRAIMNRHHQARRSHSGIAPKIEPNSQLQHGSRGHVFAGQSPQLQPTPSSQATSSNPTSPIYGVMTPPASDRLAQHQQQQQHRQQQAPNAHPQPAYSMSMAVTASNGPAHVPITSGPGSSDTCSTSTYYTSPFQTHQDQLGKLTPPSPLPCF